MGVSFQKTASQKGSLLVERPMAVNRGLVQAVKATVSAQVIFRGCAGMNFRATLPFNGMV